VRIFHNALYKLAALLVACVLWAATQGFQSVEEGIDVPVSLEGIPEDVVVVDWSAREINLQIKGSRAALRRAERELARYPISLEGVKPGEARFQVETSHLPTPRGAEIASRSPSTIVLRIEERIRKRVQVRADVFGDPAPGHEIVSVSLHPAEVELEGARSVLRRIREANTDRVDITGLEETEEREVRLLLGAPNVWRADDEEPIRIRIDVRPSEPEAPGQTGGEG
jgi:YbbR domain-containing protein